MQDTTVDNVLEIPSLGRNIGPYKLIREAGRGGMSTVYEAVDTRDGRLVAVKTLAPMMHLSDQEQHKHLTRLQRESSSIARLRHPHLVNVLDRGTVGDTPESRIHYLVLEYVQGETLSERLARTGPLSVGEALALSEQIAWALDAVHALGVVHRDIKPGNIMILPDGAAKLMDFGVARLRNDTEVTLPGTIIGSPAYMAPEQARGERTTSASDRWSFAAVLYAMLAGRSPFAAENIPATLYQVTHGTAGPIPNVPPAVMEVFARAFDRTPTGRYLSAQALADAFRISLTGQGGNTPATLPRTKQTRRGKGEDKIWLSVPIFATLALVTFLFISRIETQQPSSHETIAVADNTADAEVTEVAPSPSPVAPRRQRSTPLPANRVPVITEHTPVRTLKMPKPAPLALSGILSPPPSPTPLTAVPIVAARTPLPVDQGRATSLEKEATPSPVPLLSPPVVAEPAVEAEAALTDTDEAVSFVGVWQGTHTGSKATLNITNENAESDTFSGALTVNTAAGPVTIAVQGRLQDDQGFPEIVLEEKRVIEAPAPHSWDLGRNRGRLKDPDTMQGSGRDKQGRSYTWSFHR